jgi:hypothetical protein
VGLLTVLGLLSRLGTGCWFGWCGRLGSLPWLGPGAWFGLGDGLGPLLEGDGDAEVGIVLLAVTGFDLDAAGRRIGVLVGHVRVIRLVAAHRTSQQPHAVDMSHRETTS